jgi:colanic acid/amylovoran biosynthesis glycosyltransferase
LSQSNVRQTGNRGSEDGSGSFQMKPEKIRNDANAGDLSSRTVLLFTMSYPYDSATEITFLSEEIEWFARRCKKVVTVPASLRGKLYLDPPRFENEPGLAEAINGASKALWIVRSLASPAFYAEILSKPRILFSPYSLKRLVAYIGLGRVVRDWTKLYLKQKGLKPDAVLLFTFWLDYVTFGLATMRAKQTGQRLISRAHGVDLYEERFRDSYIPCRRQTLRYIDKLYLASDAARQYLMKNYPAFSAKYGLARIGTPDPGFSCKRSDDGIFRIVSCSTIFALKRLPLLIEGLTRLGNEMTGRKFEWHHFGDGPQRREIEGMVGKLPPNVSCTLHGHVPIKGIMAFYRDTPVDCFITTTSTEGGCPVSIKEAQSCGISAIGTAVGGVPEIVTNDNGVLLSKDPSPAEIADAIRSLATDPAGARAKRTKSRKDWERLSDEKGLCSEFMTEIGSLIGGRQ